MLTTELEEALAEVKFGYELDEKTSGDLVDYAEDILKEHDNLILALAKSAVIDRMMAAASSGETIILDADLAAQMQAEIGTEVGRILKPELDRRSGLQRSETPVFRP